MKLHIGKHRNKVITGFAIILILYVVLLVNIKKIETLVTFPGIAINIQDLFGHVKSNPDFEEINIQTTKWENINGLYFNKNAEKTVYYFHGNGGPLNYFYSEIEYIGELGYNVMAYDYPGYGKSTGMPYKENVEEYSQLFYEDIKTKKNLIDEEIIIWGYSVGTAVATDFASRNNFAKIILISPLASRYDMSMKFFWFPIQQILFRNNSFITKDLVKTFTQPALIIHGNVDNIVPYSHGEMVFKNYGSYNPEFTSKTFIEIDGFSHNYIINVYGKALEEKFLKFLKSWTVDDNKPVFLLGGDDKKMWEEQSNNYTKIFLADLVSDNSITKFVNSSVPYNDKWYVPANLTRFSSEFVADGKGNWKLRAEVIPELNELAKAFYKEFNTRFTINSSYRSYAYQKWIKDRGCPDNVCAKAGFSEHQSGLWFDIFAIESESYWKNRSDLWSYYEWLDKNAAQYGFTNTYKKGLEIDGYDIEPWHWRYVWRELAQYLSNNKITIAEFYDSQQK
jgi:LAS superfamily LD-carboxypeptidase LdcB/pimeloyl-ACP methyl ester carboxylesterase